MNILENNLNLLRNKNPKLAEKILKHNDIVGDFVLDEALSGVPNLKRNGIFLHDNTDPEEEAINLLRNIGNKKSNSFNYIYGLGLGYVLKRFNKALKGLIIVYEKDLDVLRIAFELVDFSEELKNNNVFILDNLDDIAILYDNYFFYEYDISTSISNIYKDYDFDNAQEFTKYLGYTHGIYASNYTSYWDKNHIWIDAVTSNLKYIPKYDELRVLKNKFKNKPAIVISAGPSLNKNIDLISKYQDNFIILCVGTALKSALKHGIKPDFVCFVEYLPVTKKMIENAELDYTNLILQPITLSDIYDTNTKNKFIFYADNDEGANWVAKKFNIDRTEYINRGTVSVNALATAKILGCNPIVLTGQDLAYTNNSCYADGAIYDTYKLKDGKVIVDGDINEVGEKTGLGVQRVQNRLNVLTNQLYKVKGQNGETLLSPGDYASFIKFFEEIAKSYSKDTKLINATEGGAQINGYENMKFADVVEKFAKGNIDKSVNHKTTNIEKRTKIIYDELIKSIKLFENYYNPILQKACKLAKEININYDDEDNFIKFANFTKEMLKFYAELKKLEKTDLLNLLFSRDTFFIDNFINKIEDDTNFNFLVKYLHILFAYDYEGFILPQINKIKTFVQ